MTQEIWQSLYLVISGAIFSLLAVFHLLRLIYHWSIVAGTRGIPHSLLCVGFPVSIGYSVWAARCVAVLHSGLLTHQILNGQQIKDVGSRSADYVFGLVPEERELLQLHVIRLHQRRAGNHSTGNM
jgi:hypothetical protein